MEEHKASLQFVDYMVIRTSYDINEDFSPDKEKALDVEFDVHTIIYSDENYSYVKMMADVGDMENKQCPFLIEAEILGVFSYEGEEDKKEMFLKNSAVAVLFPYLRNIISELSTMSNNFPTYRLPLINIMSYLNDNNKIEYRGYTSED